MHGYVSARQQRRSNSHEGMKMPQAPEHLRASWNDFSAWLQLRPNFVERSGVILKKPGYKPTEDDFSAIDYLFLEWDYGYDPDPEAWPSNTKEPSQ